MKMADRRPFGSILSILCGGEIWIHFDFGLNDGEQDTFSSIPGKTAKNESGSIADDSYHRFEEDIALMAALNLSAFRLSIAWPRILPDGFTVNQKAIEHYKKLVSSLKSHGITPFVTLYHWDLPQSVYDETNGGWTNESIVSYFEHYAETVFAALADDVDYWFTLNDPWTFCVSGYSTGRHAPGRCSDRTRCQSGNSSIEIYQCAHHALLAHAAAVRIFRANKYSMYSLRSCHPVAHCDLAKKIKFF